MFKRFGKWIMQHRSIEDLMVAELDMAHRALLSAQTGVEFAQSEVVYNEQRIARLTRQIDEIKKPEKFDLRITGDTFIPPKL